MVNVCAFWYQVPPIKLDWWECQVKEAHQLFRFMLKVEHLLLVTFKDLKTIIRQIISVPHGSTTASPIPTTTTALSSPHGSTTASPPTSPFVSTTKIAFPSPCGSTTAAPLPAPSLQQQLFSPKPQQDLRFGIESGAHYSYVVPPLAKTPCLQDPVVIAERFHFHWGAQAEGESINEYLAELTTHFLEEALGIVSFVVHEVRAARRNYSL